MKQENLNDNWAGQWPGYSYKRYYDPTILSHVRLSTIPHGIQTETRAEKWVCIRPVLSATVDTKMSKRWYLHQRGSSSDRAESYEREHEKSSYDRREQINSVGRNARTLDEGGGCYTELLGIGCTAKDIRTGNPREGGQPGPRAGKQRKCLENDDIWQLYSQYWGGRCGRR